MHQVVVATSSHPQLQFAQQSIQPDCWPAALLLLLLLLLLPAGVHSGSSKMAGSRLAGGPPPLAFWPPPSAIHHYFSHSRLCSWEQLTFLSDRARCSGWGTKRRVLHYRQSNMPNKRFLVTIIMRSWRPCCCTNQALT
jgi:hypothetical protein